jgi:hypothetical protein
MGDWEGDLIVGRMSRSAIGMLVDRSSRYLRLIHLPQGHTAERFHTALLPVLDTTPPELRLTLTWDQGSEMAHHDQLAEHSSKASTLPTLLARGYAERTRTPTACSASTSPTAHICGYTTPMPSGQSNNASTTGRGRASDGAHQPRYSTRP